MLLEREPYHTKVEKANGERIGLRAGKPMGGVNHTIGLHRALWLPFDLDLSTARLISRLSRSAQRTRIEKYATEP
jgi:hypothetical protein